MADYVKGKISAFAPPTETLPKVFKVTVMNVPTGVCDQARERWQVNQ
jgi:hypothetical protein